MNLYDMVSRKDKRLQRGSSVVAGKRVTLDGGVWRGLRWRGAGDEVRIQRVLECYPFRHRPETCGWQAWGRVEAVLQWQEGGQRREVPLGGASGGGVLPAPLRFRWPGDVPPEADLVLRAPGGRAFLGVHRALWRWMIRRHARGTGMELGPGPNPQILPGRGVNVRYVEQKSPEEWASFYNDAGKFTVDPALWSRYAIGDAAHVPAEDESLDFIFSCHMFEHLANPLGHLEHWRAKLRRGGKVLAIVPDVAGSKDYVHAPSTLEELLAEHAAGVMEPQLRHYQRWAAFRGGIDPAQYLAEGRSIHVHFYTRENIEALLRHAVARLGYARYRLMHRPNHKDFYFVLVKA